MSLKALLVGADSMGSGEFSESERYLANIICLLNLTREQRGFQQPLIRT